MSFVPKEAKVVSSNVSWKFDRNFDALVLFKKMCVCVELCVCVCVCVNERGVCVC